ncbi:MAG TPA: ATP-binding protein [Acetobacteraceae bacterium]|nr:ATP-binding protein [Acetobacteraceae bacterium]
MHGEGESTGTLHRVPSWPRLSAEDRFARVVDASPTALVLTGRNGRIEMTNRQAQRMFGYGDDELQGKPLEMLLPERFRGTHVGLRSAFFTNLAPRLMGEGRELYGLRKNGSEFPLEIGLSPIELDGETMVVAGIIDVTLRHEAEREKEQQRRELERSNADLEEFAYVASHDLKAPLRAISHLAQWITQDVEATATPETLDNLKLLQGRVTRLQKLLDGLLAYSRVGRGQSEVDDVDVGETVRDIATLLGPPAGFTVTYEGAPGKLHTHRAPLRVVLENLISNALKHHDRCEGKVTVAMRRIGKLAEFRVTDDGPGIPTRFHDRIFVIFQTLESRDDVESSGIGLAIVKKKVESHGGDIKVESAPPARGTAFVFTWPESPP